MTEETPIKDHMIKMITFFNDIQIFRTEINEETKVNVVLETLQNPTRSSS